MPSAAYGSLPFKEQINFFRAKKDVLTESYLDVWETEHDTAFMVAGANRSDLLTDLRASIDAAIAGGTTLEEFRRDFDDIVAKHGWDYTGGRNWRTRVIYETNLRQSYNAGRWQQLQKLKKVRPYWRYRHCDGEAHPRPIHLSWNNLVLHCDDPWWATHFPANGWGCKCYVEALAEEDLAELGKTGPDKAPEIEWQTVTVGQRSPGGPRQVLTPVGIDPGFAYAPGRSLYGGNVPPPPIPGMPSGSFAHVEQATQAALSKLTQRPLVESIESAAEVLSIRRAQSVLDAGYSLWQGAVLEARQERNLTYYIGSLTQDVAEALQAQSITPITAPIVMRDVELLHMTRDLKQAGAVGRAKTLSPADIRQLPQLLRTPRAVLLQRRDQRLLYVIDADGHGGKGKVIVAVNYRLQTDQRTKETANAIITAGVIDLPTLRGQVKGDELALLTGSLE